MNVITLILIVIRAGSKAGVYGLGFIELGLTLNSNPKP